MENSKQKEDHKRVRLKACPFCGGKAAIAMRFANRTKGVLPAKAWVSCSQCGAPIEMYEQDMKYCKAAWREVEPPGQNRGRGNVTC